MRKLTPLLILSSLVVTATSVAEPVCHKCEKVREYNAAHPENNYEWYDDYLKDQKNDKESVQKTDKNTVPTTSTSNK